VWLLSRGLGRAGQQRPRNGGLAHDDELRGGEYRRTMHRGATARPSVVRLAVDAHLLQLHRQAIEAHTPLHLARELPRPDSAIFADTGWNPVAVNAPADRVQAPPVAAEPPLCRVGSGDLWAAAQGPGRRHRSLAHDSADLDHTTGEANSSLLDSFRNKCQSVVHAT
jgi:hypothetical protein